MSQISSYPVISDPTLSDLLIGTDVGDINNTKNFRLSDIAALIGISYVPYIGATGNLNMGLYSVQASAFIVNEGSASQFLKADGSLDATAYVPQSRTITINGLTYDLSINREWDLPTIDSLTTIGTGGSATYIGKVLNIPVYQQQGDYITQLSGEATALGPGNASVILDNTAVISKILSGLNITGGNVVATDSILQAFGKVQNQINSLVGGVQYKGTWNAATNTPTLQSSVGNQGEYYVVSVPGTTDLNGITDWNLGDWAIYDGTAWQQVDNTDAVVSVNGYTGAVELTYSDVDAAPAVRLLTINGTSYDLSADRSWVVGDVRTDGSYANPTWITSLNWSKITNTPTTLSGYGITDGVNQSRTLTINGIEYDLSANRAWLVGTVTSIATSGPLTGGIITGSGTIGITKSAASVDGYLSGADWVTFNAKQDALVPVAPIYITGSNIGINQSGASSNGFLSSTDWNTFNSKQDALINPVTGTGTAYTIPMWSGPNMLTNSSISLLSNTYTFGYNSTTGASVVFLNNGAAPYAYTITMNNFGSPRITTHSYTDGVIAEVIGSTQVRRVFANGNTIFGLGTADTGYKIFSEGGVYAEYLTLDPTPATIPTAQGSIYFDQDEQTVAAVLNGSIMKIGEDSFFQIKNQSGATIPKGTAVRFDGVVGSSGRVKAVPFLADGTYPSLYFLGVTYESIPDGGDGKALILGKIRGINTNAYPAGTILYASTTVAGGYQTTAPVAPNNIISVAAVVTQGVSNGTILVRPQLGSNINNDEGVCIIAPVTGDILQLQAGGLWENKSIASLALVPQSRILTINGVGYDLSADRTWSVGTITSLTGEATASGSGAVAVTLDNNAVTGKLLTGLNITGGTVVSTDSILVAFGKLQNELNGLIGGSVYQGTWNASTNTPALTSSVGTRGHYYVVSVAGTTNLNGITDWQIGDWAIYDGASWQKVDNTDAVISVNGYSGNVSLVTGDVLEGAGTLPGRPTQLYFTEARSRLSLSFAAGSGAYNSSTGLITIPTNTDQLTNGASFITLASLSGVAPIQYNSGTGAISITQAGASSDGYLNSADWNTFNNKVSTATLAGYVPTSRTLTINGVGYDLSANRSWTIPTHDAVTLGTANGLSLSGQVLSLGLASSINAGALSASDWIAFNSKQNALTNPVTGTGTVNYIPKFSGTTIIGNSQVFDNGTSVLVGGLTNVGNITFQVNGTARVSGVLTLNSTITNGTHTYTLPSSTGTLALTSQLSGYVPTSRTLTINGVGYDLSADRSWTIASGVTSFNTRTGAITLTSGDVTGALGYTPVQPNGTGASGTWGISISGNATYSLNSTRLYASDAPYNYGGTNPYYMYMTYDGSRWFLQVSPASPSAVRVSYADSSGSASSVAWGGVTGKPSFIMFYEGFTLNADTMSTNSTGFTYSVNAPFTGPIARFSTGGSYDLWLGGSYSGGNNFYLRTRNGDAGIFNSWKEIVHSGNIGSQSVNFATTAIALNSSNQINQAGSQGSWNADFQNTPNGTTKYGGDVSANGVNGPGGSWWMQQNFRHTNSSSFWGVQVAWGWEDNANRLATRNITGGNYGGWVYYLNSSNYNSYSPTLTGGGASGTWGINITGSANYANYSDYSNSVELTGGNYIWFNGSGYHNVRMYEAYGVTINCVSTPWNFQVINGSIISGFQPSGGNYGSGNIYATGDVTAYYSDGRLKYNLSRIDNALSKVLLLNGYTYQHNKLGQELLNENPNKIHAGLVAQEVQAVLPEVVTIAPFDLDGYDENGKGISKSGNNYLTIKYERTIPLLIEAIKELDADNKYLRAQIEELKKSIN